PAGHPQQVGDDPRRPRRAHPHRDDRRAVRAAAPAQPAWCADVQRRRPLRRLCLRHRPAPQRRSRRPAAPSVRRAHHRAVGTVRRSRAAVLPVRPADRPRAARRRPADRRPAPGPGPPGGQRAPARGLCARAHRARSRCTAPSRGPGRARPARTLDAVRTRRPLRNRLNAMLRRAAALLALILLTGGAGAGEARFARVDYRGDDGGPAPAQDQYRNPVVAGFYPDPSAIRVGDDFYLVTSSVGYYPGLPLFHSTDLVSWRQIGNAIDRPDQLPYGDGEELTRGLFAATLAHDGRRFYIANTCFYCPGRGMGNFVITADDPAGPWSDPAWVEFNGIDPSLFLDDDGRAWLVHNDVPEGEMRYDGHRAIWLRGFDPATLSLTGEAIQLVDAGV